MSSRFTELIVKKAALAWLEGLGYTILHGPEIAIGMPGAERTDPGYRDVVLERRLCQALVLLNPELPAEALEDAFRRLTRADAPSLIEHNRAHHRMSWRVSGACPPSLKSFGPGLRDFRNYVHPAEQLAHGFLPDTHTARIGFQVVIAAAEDLVRAAGAAEKRTGQAMRFVLRLVA